MWLLTISISPLSLFSEACSRTGYQLSNRLILFFFAWSKQNLLPTFLLSTAGLLPVELCPSFSKPAWIAGLSFWSLLLSSNFPTNSFILFSNLAPYTFLLPIFLIQIIIQIIIIQIIIIIFGYKK